MLTKEALTKLIDTESDSHIAFLQKLVQTPSPNPPGDTTAAIDFVRRFLADKNIESELLTPKPSNPNLVSVLQDPSTSSSARNLVLNGHIDHFPVASAKEWQRDPYSGDVENGYLHGCGSVDMKAGTAASIIAFTYLHRFKDQLKGQAVLEVVSDEETGGKFGTKHLLEEDDRKDLWRGSCALNAEPCGMQSIRFAEKGTLRITFNVDCEGGHGAYIHRSEGAIRIAARLIERLIEIEQMRGKLDPALEDYLSRKDVRRVANEIMSPGAADSMVKPTANIGTIRGGAKVNMIPSSCVFEVDIRLPIGLLAETVLKRIDEILEDFPGVSYEVQKAASNPAAASSIEHELVDLIQRNAENIGITKPLAISSLGATDCKHFRYNGIPAYSHGLSPSIMAEKDERVSVQDFLHLFKVHTLAAWDYFSV